MFEDVVKQFLDQLIGGDESAFVLSDDSGDWNFLPTDSGPDGRPPPYESPSPEH